MKLIESYYKAFNAGDMEAFLAHLSKDVVHEINQGSVEIGKEKFRLFMQRMQRCYLETVSDLVIMGNSEGNRVAVEYVVSGKYLATDAGLPTACGQTYRLPGGAFFTVQSNLIQRVTNYYNLNLWLSQISAQNGER